MTLTMSTDTFMCNSDTTLIFALVTGGLGTGYQYSWNSGLSDTFIIWCILCTLKTTQ